MKRHNFLFLQCCLLLFALSGYAQNIKTSPAQPDNAQTSPSVKYPDLREKLLKRLNAARAIRTELTEKYNGAIPMSEANSIMKMDNENQVWLKSVVEKYGWLGKSLVGEDGEDAAFRLVRAATEDAEFQKRCLALLQKAVKDGEAPVEQPKILAERIAEAGGQLSASSGNPSDRKSIVVPVQTNDDKTTQIIKNPQLRDELLQRIKSDQAIRTEAMKNYSPGKPLSSEIVERFKAIDKENTARMKEIINQYGYPGYSSVGRDGEQIAFLLIQHADQDLEFQKQCLELLRKAVELKDAAPASLAYLTDRVLVAEGKPQIYGTQSRLTNGKFEVAPIENAENVDKRRAEVGLEPLADYIEKMRQRYQNPKPVN